MKTPLIQGNGEIRIIGGRSSGKTTLMAALAYWPNGNPQNSPIQSVEPFDTETAQLIDMAQDILENGQQLPPSRLGQQSLYSLIIQLKANFLLNPLAATIGRNIRLQVSCREYSGELVEQLRNNLDDLNLNNYLDDCALASGLLVLIDGTSMLDREYAQALDKLQSELNFRLTNNNRDKRKYRIAFVFSKAEHPQVWNYQKNIKQFIGLRFPKTQIALQNWRRIWGCQVACFFCSAFGTMGDPPQPNCKIIHQDDKATRAVIYRPQFWKPFGLIAPIYWLHTGQGDVRLRQI